MEEENKETLLCCCVDVKSSKLTKCENKEIERKSSR